MMKRLIGTCHKCGTANVPLYHHTGMPIGAAPGVQLREVTWRCETCVADAQEVS